MFRLLSKGLRSAALGAASCVFASGCFTVRLIGSVDRATSQTVTGSINPIVTGPPSTQAGSTSVVGIYQLGTQTLLSTGVWVSDGVVISAASIVSQYASNQLELHFADGTIGVADPEETTVVATLMFTPAGFTPGQTTDDLAVILYTQGTVSTSTRKGYAALPANEAAYGTATQVTQLGFRRESMTPDLLRDFTQFIADDGISTAIWAGPFNSAHHISVEPTASGCAAEYGAPLFVDDLGTPVLVGLRLATGLCAVNPPMYTRVYNYLGFITGFF